jgi:DNA-binding winged helix-turn-helix (wHTH) protein
MPPTMPSPRTVRFGLFELDVRAGELRKRGLRVPLQGLPIQILTILLENSGQVVTREDLRTRLWPADTFVDFDHSLHNAIARLREALGEDATNPRFIETLPRRGYRFLRQLDLLPQPALTPDKAKELDPLAPMMSSGIAHRLCAAGRLEEAIQEAKSALELNPNLPLAHMDLGDVYLRQANFAEAIAEFKKTVQLSHNNQNFVADLAYAYAASGDRDHAWELLKDLQQMPRSRHVPPYQLAAVYAGLGEKRRALQALDEAYKEQSPWMNNLLLDRRLDSLRKEPEFARLLAAMKFPDKGQMSPAKR